MWLLVLAQLVPLAAESTWLFASIVVRWLSWVVCLVSWVVSWEPVSQALGHAVVLVILGFSLVATLVRALGLANLFGCGFGPSVWPVVLRRLYPGPSGLLGPWPSALLASKPSRLCWVANLAHVAGMVGFW